MVTIIEIFKRWLHMKVKLHNKKHQPPLVHETDVWWISFGENVGSEINGKSDLFTRPGLILKKLSRSFYLVAPTTSKPHEGSWYVSISLSEKQTYVCLQQIRVIDYRRLFSRLGQIDKVEFRRVKDGFLNLYK